MTDELHEFLRQAAQRQGGAQRKARPPVQETPIEAEIVATENANQAERPIPPERASLAGPLAASADALASHLHATFDHKVGSLSASLITPTTNLSQPAAQPLPLLNLLASPEGILQAIILTEILQRPEQRWNESES